MSVYPVEGFLNVFESVGKLLFVGFCVGEFSYCLSYQSAVEARFFFF